MFSKSIQHSVTSVNLAPNLMPENVQTAWRFLLYPKYRKQWQQGSAFATAQTALAEILSVKPHNVFLLDSARSGLFALLGSLGIGRDDEVILQAYTCVVVPNAILWNQATPVYVDVDNTFTMDIADLRKKITKKTKAIIVQHSFGSAADMDEIMAIAHEHNCVVIEDCAINLGGTYDGKMVGTIGHAAVYSFGRDKVLSTVSGGAVVLNDSFPDVARKSFTKTFGQIEVVSKKVISQMLWHMVLMPWVLRFYTTGHVGKIMLRFAQMVGLINKAYQPCEYLSEKPTTILRKMSNAQSIFLIQQLGVLEDFISHRQKIARIYSEKFKGVSGITLPNTHKKSVHTFLRYPVLVDNPKGIANQLKKEGILLDFWYNKVVMPASVDLKQVGYMNDCPQAEDFARQSLNLPTHYYITDAIADQIASKIIKELNR